MRRLISFCTIAVFLFFHVFPVYAAELQALPNARLIDRGANDGDSFYVNVSGKDLLIRLYFVDCPEISVSMKSDARRLREQTRYFGLAGTERTQHFGKEAKKFVSQTLTKLFTVYTAYASALGRSSGGRVYAFVTTAGGEDLASILVKNGLARTYGVGRKTPDGVPRDEMVHQLRDLESAAMLKRSGIWSESDPDRIIELRARQRREDQELKDIQKQSKKTGTSVRPLDPNTATKDELDAIPGIGPTLAARIVAGRPYKTTDDLLKVKGIGKKKLENLRKYLSIDNNL